MTWRIFMAVNWRISAGIVKGTVAGRCWVGLMLWCSAALPAQAERSSVLVHCVAPGETLRSIATDYYGSRRRAAVLATENGLEGEQSLLVPGQRLHVPQASFHRVAAGETWAQLAERFYGDRQRAFVFQIANHLPVGRQAVAGSEVIVPYPLRHVVRRSATLTDVAQLYYGERSSAGLVRRFNALSSSRLKRGQILLVPLADLVWTSASLKSDAGSSAASSSSNQTGRGEDNVDAELPALQEQLRRGQFVEVVASGSRLLASSHLNGKQIVVVQTTLGIALLALERRELSLQAFRSALRLQPTLKLDRHLTSPKILAAFEEARQAQDGRH